MGKKKRTRKNKKENKNDLSNKKVKKSSEILDKKPSKKKKTEKDKTDKKESRSKNKKRSPEEKGEISLPWISELVSDQNILESEEEIQGLTKEAYQEEHSFETSNERNRLKELLKQASKDSSGEMFGGEESNLEHTASSVQMSSEELNDSQETSYNKVPTQYMDPAVYQSTKYQTKDYEEIKRDSGERIPYEAGLGESAGTISSQVPENVYTPKPVERFGKGNDTGFALGADKEREEVRGKYRLR